MSGTSTGLATALVANFNSALAASPLATAAALAIVSRQTAM